ncbi:hypothetical protein HPB51_009866 [Rhipicephalus microplus]|uniref:Coatomer subunit gamma C-terminal domain-containing protein n=1 Tax=Rhipicephalus microplus TaxID=6941 RepID=A0A9J6ESV7_RHIMP|nr:hypothetical protein HPB51_009866 [Rhipicephalus microplus]
MDDEVCDRPVYFRHVSRQRQKALGTRYILNDAVQQIVQFPGTQVCKRLDKVPVGKRARTLLLPGVDRGGHNVLVRGQLVTTGIAQGVTVNLAVQSKDTDICQVIISVVR